MRTFARPTYDHVSLWQVERNEQTIVISTGRVGYPLTEESRRPLDATEIAQSVIDALIRQILLAGYVEITPQRFGGTQALLEAALIADPDDMVAHRAYADHLMEAGDPRGELTMLHLRIEAEDMEEAELGELRRQSWQLLPRCEGWYGPFVRYALDADDDVVSSRPHFTLRRGWIDHLVLERCPPEAVIALLLNPLTALTRSLDMLALHAPLLTIAWPNVQHFKFGPDAEWFLNQGDPRTLPDGSDLPRLFLKMPRLIEVQILAVDMHCESLCAALPPSGLELLQIYGFSELFPLGQLGQGTKGHALATLRLRPATAHATPDEPEAGYLPLSVVQKLTPQRFPNLHHLELTCSSMGDAGIMHLIDSKLLDQLQTLDLKHGCITDVGAQRLARAWNPQGLLRTIDLTGNWLSETGVRLLAGAGIDAVVRDQIAADDPFRERYLFQGFEPEYE